jgi:hypothetical protein
MGRSRIGSPLAPRIGWSGRVDAPRGPGLPMDERNFFTESNATKAASLQCPSCRSTESYDLRWLVRKKKNAVPPGADERDRARFQKAQSYMVLLDDKVACKNLRCRKRFDISGVKTMAFLVDDPGLPR